MKQQNVYHLYYIMEKGMRYFGKHLKRLAIYNLMNLDIGNYEIVLKDAYENIISGNLKNKKRLDSGKNFTAFRIGDKVLLRNERQSIGVDEFIKRPYVIKERIG